MSGMMMKSVQKQKKRKINKALFPFTTNKWSEGICKKKSLKDRKKWPFLFLFYQYELSSFILFTVNIVLRNANYNGDTEALGQELKAKGQVCLSPRVPIENRWIHREFEWKDCDLLPWPKRDNGKELCGRAYRELEARRRSSYGEQHLPSQSSCPPISCCCLLLAKSSWCQRRGQPR